MQRNLPLRLVSTLPEGIAVLVGNDTCTAVPVADVSVVTRSQTAQARQSASQNVAAPAIPLKHPDRP